MIVKMIVKMSFFVEAQKWNLLKHAGSSSAIDQSYENTEVNKTDLTFTFLQID